MRGYSLLLLVLLPAVFSLEVPEQCDELDCWSRKDLLKALDRYRNQLDKVLGKMSQAPEQPKRSRAVRFDEIVSTTQDPILTCNICNSHPCQNGGTCQVDSSDPWNKWICQCPGNYTGSTCEIPVRCESNTCGNNTICSVSNHQTNCICDQGFSGDPKVGCNLRQKSACCYGDPHYTTFDGLYFDYMGTCPAVYSEPCTGLSGGYDNFKVVQKSVGSNVAAISAVTTIMYGQEIHFEGGRMYFNKVQISSPYYWPSASQRNITVAYAGSIYSATSNQQVQVTLSGSKLCVYVPDIPEFRGANTLCGLAGNIDDNYKNDVRYRNGTVYPNVVSQHMPTPDTSLSFNQAEDTWIESDYWAVSPALTCSTGATYSNNSNCNPNQAVQICDPILQAMSGNGPFGLCQPMGNASIQQLYDNCVFDVCHNPTQPQTCSSFTDFVQQCMQALPDTDLGPWRATTNCPKVCGPNSQYSSCTSSCPATCAQHDAPSSCNEGCIDSCECIYGYVVDNSITTATTCIPIGECGCDGPDGNMHGADSPWLNDNCTVSAVCTNGTYNSQPVQCDQYAFCGPDDKQQTACQCDPGFRGDGYNCTDINECVEDPHSCGADVGWGTCTNTIGSYNCTCNLYREGRDCENYMPTRHCADLVKYWNATNDGVYTLHFPQINGSADYSNVDVFCDMTTDGGGWTLMSHSNSNVSNIMFNKYYADYEIGFGNATLQNYWLGLEIQNFITSDVKTSLRLKIFRCAKPNVKPNMTTECVYPTFLVNEGARNYSVFIPDECVGTEQAQQWDDGWIRWNQAAEGPGFQTWDRHDDVNCPSRFEETGWWYYTAKPCGAAALNGQRFSCDSMPTDTTLLSLEWAGGPLRGDVWMYLRPADFPNY